MKQYRPLFEIVIDKLKKESGMIRNSLVYSPAVRQELFKFDENQEVVLKFASNTPEQVFTSISILADTPIARRTKDGKEFDVLFTKETIKEIRNKLIKDGKGNELSINHDSNEIIEGVYLVEMYTLDKDRVESKLFKDAPDGSLVTSYWVEDKATFDALAADVNFKGLSIEINGLLNHLFSDESDSRIIIPADKQASVLSQLDAMGEVLPEDWEERTNDEYVDAMKDSIEEFSDAHLKVNSRNDFIDKANGGKWFVRYVYEGPRDEKNRHFCNEVLMINKIYTQEQIENDLSNAEFGEYSIFDFKGSYGCRHVWSRKVYFQKAKKKAQIVEEPEKLPEAEKVISSLEDSGAMTKNIILAVAIKAIVDREDLTDEEKEAKIKLLLIGDEEIK